MNILKNKYIITGWNGMKYYFTAEELKNKILADAKSSDYNWFAPAKVIIETCNNPSFPTKDAIFIKIAILNCFSNIANRANSGGDRYESNPENDAVIMDCYNSLYCINSSDSISARKKYLTEILRTASDPLLIDPLSNLSCSSTFQNLRNKWIQIRFYRYISKEKIDLKTLEKSLTDDFSRIIQKARSKGLFKQDTLREENTFESITHAIQPTTISSGDPEIWR